MRVSAMRCALQVSTVASSRDRRRLWLRAHDSNIRPEKHLKLRLSCTCTVKATLAPLTLKGYLGEHCLIRHKRTPCASLSVT